MADRCELNNEELNQVSGGAAGKPSASAYKYGLGATVLTTDGKQLVVQQRGYKIVGTLCMLYYKLGTQRYSDDGAWYLCNMWGDLSVKSDPDVILFD